MQCTAEGDTPLELAFLDDYGPIQKHLWFGDGYILVGFKSGQVRLELCYVLCALCCATHRMYWMSDDWGGSLCMLVD